MKVSERIMSTPQKVSQMQHYWDNLWHMTPDKDKKKNLEKRFGIKNIKVDKRGKILSFEEVEKSEVKFEKHDNALIAETGDICSISRSNLKSKAMQSAWDKKCNTNKPDKRSIFGKAAKGLNLYNQKVARFEQFLEAKQKTVVFSFGRLNPPTTGHQKLLQKIIQTAKQLSGQPKLYVSYSQDSKKNPLTAKQKIAYIKKMFPKEARQLELKDNSSIRNAMDIATVLNGNYDNLVMVVGSDRVKDFKTLLNKYNGVESRHGFYKYDNIQIVSAGERDPDAEGVAGMSASKMRAAAASGDYECFSLGLPPSFKDGEKLFKDLRLGMNVKEQLKPFKPIVEMTNMELIREQYFQNLIYNIGDWVKDTKTGITGEVVKRGTNYITLVQEDFTLHKIWLEDVESMEKQEKKLPEAINFLKNRNLWEKVQRENRKSAGEKEDSHKKEWGTKSLTDRCKRITPGETVKESKEGLKKFASKFKIPTNVASAIWRKLADAGIDPLKINQYSTLLSTYINLMDEKLPEVAPPGKEKQILKLKKKFGKDSDIPYRIAWSQHNKKKG